MSYKEIQRKLQVQKLLYKYPELFNRDKGGAPFDEYQSLTFVLQDGENNLFSNIRSNVVDYFNENHIAWWGDNQLYPTGHLLSSQIQCLNYLFMLRNDQEAVLQLARLFDREIDAVYQIPSDKQPTYLAFEFTYKNDALLNENDRGAQRGAYCTSVDAFLVAARKGKKLLMPIEWKYTENYLEYENKALEGNTGQIRQSRYNHLILESKQLKSPSDLANSLYYFEPYYELMRQTLLVEQMVKSGVADDYLHILVLPQANSELLQKSYVCGDQNLVETWKNQLKNPEKFKMIDSAQIIEWLEQMPGYSALGRYLKLRYY